MARPFLTPVELTKVDNSVGDILTISAGNIVSRRTAEQILSDIGAAAVSHTHTIAQVTNLQSTLDGKAASSHNHAAGDINSGTFNIARIPTGTTGSTVALGNHNHSGVYAPVSHSHAVADVTGLQGALDGKAATSHNHTLDSLSNVTISSNSSGELLAWNGTAWINRTIAEAGVAAASHTHTIANITNLQSSLDGKANTSHSHAISDVTNLQSSLDGKAATSHNHAAGDINSGRFVMARMPTSGTANRVLKVGTANSDPVYGQVAWGELTGVPGTFTPSSHSHAISDVTGLQGALDGKAATSHSHAISDITNLQSTLDGKSGTGHNHTLDSLSNVTITSNANGEILRWNGSAWINNTLAEAGIAAASHSHAAGDVTSGTFDIARIPTGTTGSTVALGNHTHSGVYAPVSHSHAISDVTNLQSSLDGKLDTGLAVLLTGNQTIAGTKTFSSTISGSVSGSAATLTTARAINGVNFNGSANITVPGNFANRITNESGHLAFIGTTATGNQAMYTNTNLRVNPSTATISANTFSGALSGNATTATTLATARTIGISGAVTGTATSFNGSTNITIPITALDVSAATAGTLAVNRGGTGISSYTANNYIRASGATTLQQRTPAQVLSDIGAAAVSHTHTIANVTNLQSTLDGKANLSGGNTFTGNQVVNSGTLTVADTVISTTSGVIEEVISYTHRSVSSDLSFTGSEIMRVISFGHSDYSLSTEDKPALAIMTTVFGEEELSGFVLTSGNGDSISTSESGMSLNSDGRILLNSDNIRISAPGILPNQYVMTDATRSLVTVPRPFGEKEAFMINPQENGEYYIVMSEATTVNIPGAVTRGTGSAVYARSTNGTSFTTISTSTAFNANDVLRITVSGMATPGYFSIAIPQTGGGYSYEPLIFNPAENGEYFVTMEAAKSYDLGSITSRGTGSVAFHRSTNGTTFSSVTGNTAFSANDVLRVTVSGMSSGYYAFTIPRSA